MNLTDFGNIIIGTAYYAVAATLLIVAWSAWRKRGLLRLVHPLIWVGASMFFLGCGSHHFEFVYHHVQGEATAFDSFHHNLFVVMQVVGVVPFLAALWPFVERLKWLEVSKRERERERELRADV